MGKNDETPTTALPVAARTALTKLSELQDNWISVPTWGLFMRALGLHRTPVRRLLKQAWARRA